MILKSFPEQLREHITEIENPLDGETCYLFRCSLLHQGRTVLRKKSKYSRIIFIEPRVTSSVVHNSVFDDALCIDLVSFCKEIIVGARMWLSATENTEQYQRNYEHCVKRHPSGMKPYIDGVPVIG